MPPTARGEGGHCQRRPVQFPGVASHRTKAACDNDDDVESAGEQLLKHVAGTVLQLSSDMLSVQVAKSAVMSGNEQSKSFAPTASTTCDQIRIRESDWCRLLEHHKGSKKLRVYTHRLSS